MKRIGKFIVSLFTRHKWKTAAVFLILAIWFWLCLPGRLFDEPLSTVLEDRNGNLLGGRIAADGQWRFPVMDSVPDRFCAAIITFEDQHFFGHSGVDPLSLTRALFQNLSSGEVVSGGSTLTMQVIRLMRKTKPRNMWNKMIEAIMATRLEMTYSKREILALYASNAPFGGNVVGLKAASWRYFGRNPESLSWAETATLAVLPNSPALIHPGRNRAALKAKRDRLLDRLQEKGIFDSLDCRLAKEEPLPDQPKPLPNLAPHLIDNLNLQNQPDKAGVWPQNTRLRSTLDAYLQDRAENVVDIHARRLREIGVFNAAAIIADVETGDVLAYVGNVPSGDPAHGSSVDVIRSPRSSGSILKPFLYAAMLNEGEVLPKMLQPDIPSNFGDYSPKNFDKSYDGAVPADQALSRSLNVPAIRMLHHYGHIKFYDMLKKLGMTTLTRPADNYGLSLVLGGAEASLWDLAGMYASLARTVNQFHDYQGRYDREVVRPLNYDLSKSKSIRHGYEPQMTDDALLGAGACFLTLEALLEVSRPDEYGNWRNFASSRKIAWKTGTSYGHRDGWAVGCTPSYVVAVWAGNADGEGRAGLIGMEAAAPLMFDLFELLGGENEWFEKPFDDLRKVSICTKSGHRALDICEEQDTAWIPLSGMASHPCPYHKWVHLDVTGQHQVHSECEQPSAMLHKAWFILPPAQESYYRHKHVSYRELPPFRDDCKAQAATSAETANMELVYPRKTTRIYVPVNLDGTASSTVFEAVHRDTKMRIYWHLDKDYLGATETFHQMALNPSPGQHVLTLVDENGEELKQSFEIIGKD